MLFNSYIFVLAFLPVILVGYFGLNRYKHYAAAKIFLIISSLFFYGYFNWWYLLIIVSSVICNYFFSRIMLNDRYGRGFRKAIFAAALIINIGSLFFFKYYDFFISNINSLFGMSAPMMRLLLPLGISFFTFQQLSYVIDSYRRDKNVAKYNFFDYALFVTYFPQLIAGPIVTHDEMVPQFADPSKKTFDYDNFAAGIYAFSFGLAKKVILADTFGLMVDKAFGDVSSLGCINACLVMFSYTFQIYFDFSGYCDMATGIGKMMNIDITMNFNSPYKAISIVDFWKRWHITLTRFFTHYVYFPLGGNRKGTIRTYVNILIVFLVSGIWHGANWTFIVWGIMHGVANVFTRIIDKATGIFSKNQSKFIKIISCLITFIIVNLLWVIFRSTSLNEAWAFFSQFVNFNSELSAWDLLNNLNNDGFTIMGHLIPHFSKIVPVIFFVFAFTASFFMKNTNQRIDGFKPSFSKAVVSSILLFWCIMSFGGVSTFLYWNF